MKQARRRQARLIAVLAAVALVGGCGKEAKQVATNLPVADPDDYSYSTPGPDGTTGTAPGTSASTAAAASTAASAAGTTKRQTGGTAPNTAPSKGTVTSKAPAPAPQPVLGPPKVNEKCRQPATSVGTWAGVQGQPVADFVATTVDCKTMRFKEFTAGRPTLVNFYASWCGPCKDEAPDLQELYEEYHPQNGFVIVGVNTKDESGSPAIFYEEFGYTFASVWDDGEKILKEYDKKSAALSTLPISFWIKRDGTLSSMVIGAMSRAKMEEEMKKL